MSKNGPSYKKKQMSPEEAKKLLDTGAYDIPANPIEHKIVILQKQIHQLQEQQKNLLEFVKELGEVIMEMRIDKTEN